MLERTGGPRERPAAARERPPCDELKTAEGAKGEADSAGRERRARPGRPVWEERGQISTTRTTHSGVQETRRWEGARERHCDAPGTSSSIVNPPIFCPSSPTSLPPPAPGPSGSPFSPSCGIVNARRCPLSNLLTLPTPPRSNAGEPGTAGSARVEKIALDRTRAEADPLSEGLPPRCGEPNEAGELGTGENDGRSRSLSEPGTGDALEWNLRVGEPGVPNRVGDGGAAG